MAAEHDDRPPGTQGLDDHRFVPELNDVVDVVAADLARELHHFADHSQQVLPHSEDGLIDLLIGELVAE